VSVKLGINLEAVDGYAKAMRLAPQILLRELAEGYREIGRSDIERFRAGLGSKLKLRSPNTANAFRFWSNSPDRVTSISKLVVNEYSKWPAAKIFQTGGVIAGKDGGYLTVFPAGQRRYTAPQLRQMITAGRARFVPTPRGLLIVMATGGLTKTGKPRKGSSDIILAILVKRVTEEKRIDLYENAEGAGSIHEQILGGAVDRALQKIADAG
jgi:hypothetical protein